MPLKLTSLEICSGAGGQALGLEQAGFNHVATIENDPAAVRTLQYNRPQWHPVLEDVRTSSAEGYKGVDLFAGGVPCPPFSVAGKQLGPDDDRDLFPAAIDLISQIRPTGVLLENVPGLATMKFTDYREGLKSRLRQQGFSFVDSRILNACDFGVPQLRPRFVLVALRGKAADRFDWPDYVKVRPTVGDRLLDLMGQNGWTGARPWAARANGIAPTLVGGSKKHGGPDLGPTRAKQAWRLLGVDGYGLADAAPGPEFPFEGDPKLTVRMTARLQGFPDDWVFIGGKTAAYRQVGNAFPPPVAAAIGTAISEAITGEDKRSSDDGRIRLFAQA